MNHSWKPLLYSALVLVLHCFWHPVSGQTIRNVNSWNANGLSLKSDSLQFEDAVAYTDSGYFPKSVYLQVRISGLNAEALPYLQKGTTRCWFKNVQGDSIPCLKAPRHYAAIRDRQSGLNNLLLSLPLDPKQVSYSGWTLVFLWEHPEVAMHIRGSYQFR